MSEISVLLMQRIGGAMLITDDVIAPYQQQEHQEEEFFSESTKLPAVQTAAGRKSAETWKSAMFWRGGGSVQAALFFLCSHKLFENILLTARLARRRWGSRGSAAPRFPLSSAPVKIPNWSARHLWVSGAGTRLLFRAIVNCV